MRALLTCLLLLVPVLNSAGWAADATDKVTATPRPDLDQPQAGRIGMVVGRILESAHYKQAPLNDSIAAMFIDNYLDALDYNHLVFYQSDVDQLRKKYAKSLDDQTRRAAAQPAFEIFDLYLTRLNERTKLALRLLEQSYDFTEDDSILRQRNKAPWPADSADAEKLWRGRIKYELLQDRLAKIKTTVKEGEPAPKPYDPAEAVKTIRKRYERLLRTMTDFGSEEILQVYLTALSHAYDPHSDYMSPSEASNFDINHIKLSLSGIGARLRWEDGFTRVESLLPGGPAELGKHLKPNDRIVGVAQADGEPVDVIDMKLNKVVEMIRGPRGTEVRLTIIPAGKEDSERKTVTIIRDEIKLTEQFVKARIVDHPAPQGGVRRLAVISLPQFYDHCARDVEKLLVRLKKENVTGVVLDLRRNGGGLLDEAIELTGLFIKSGPVVQVKDNRKSVTVQEDEDPRLAWDGPLLVLVGRLSASASEIVAAALQDYGRALVVGDQATHGKGTVQSVLNLNQFIRSDEFPDAGKLKLTVSKFYRVAGGTTQKNGVTPDIVLPSAYDYMEIGESFLPNCLPADEIEPADYQRLDRIRPHLAELKKRNAERLAGDRDFAYLGEDIQRLRKQREDKTVSLNEPRLRKEKEEQETREKQRREERAARKSPQDLVFELTLESVDQNKPLTVADPKKEADEKLASNTTPVPKTAEGDEEAEDEETDPAVDPHLDEGLRILTDYLDLLGAPKGHLTATTPATP